MGSWKIIEILLPLIFLNSFSSSFKISVVAFSFSEKRILPFLYFAGGVGNNCRIDNEVTVFPDPDSPTIATVSPLFISKEIFFTAEVVPVSVTKSTLRFVILRSGKVVYGEW